MVYVLSLQQMMHILLQDEWREGFSRQHMIASLIKINKINMNLLQFVVGCRCRESWPLCGGVWLFCVKYGPKKNHIVWRDCGVPEGEFTMNKMWILLSQERFQPMEMNQP